MSPTPAGSQFAAGAFRAQPPAQVWLGFAACAKPGLSPHAGHPVGSSGTPEHRVDLIPRIEARGSILISEMGLVRTVTIVPIETHPEVHWYEVRHIRLPHLMEDHGEGPCQVSLCAEGIYHIDSAIPPPIYVGRCQRA